MKPPIPKTKYDELIEVIAGINPLKGLGEFGYARCQRLLSSIEKSISLDRANMIKSLLELHHKNPKGALALAHENYNISNNLQVLRNAGYVFQRTMAFDYVVAVTEKVIELCQKQKIDYIKSMPPDYEVNYFLAGDLDIIEADAHSVESGVLFEYLKNIQIHLEISNASLKSLMKVIHETMLESDAIFVANQYSYIDEEFLLTILVKASPETVLKLNQEIAKKCYRLGLIEELNKISYLFLPYDGENKNEQ